MAASAASSPAMRRFVAAFTTVAWPRRCASSSWIVSRGTRILLRTVLSRKMRVPRDTIQELEAHLRGHATVVKAATKRRIAGLDAADAAIIAEAVGARADVLVGGDQDLLKLADPPGKIVSPRGLWGALRRAT